MEKILKLLEEYGAVSKDMPASHGDQHNWRIMLAEAISKQQAAQPRRAADGAIEPIKCAECGDEIYPVCDACVGDMRHR